MLSDFFKRLWPWAKQTEASVRDTIEELIEESGDGEDSLDPEEKTLLTNILNLRDVCAEDVMVPRADIKAIPIDISYEDLASKLSSIRNTRIPVYRGTLDEVVGIIHVKDVLEYAGAPTTFDCRKIMQDVLFISPSMRLLDLLLQMKVTKLPMALVVDEYGGVDGLITTWDVIKEFLGDLSTVHEQETDPKFTRLSDQSMMADARLPLETLVNECSIQLTEEEMDEIDTVGGLVFSIAGHIPAMHEVIKHPSGVTFEVLEVDPRRIKKVRIYKSKREEESANETEAS